MSSSSSFSMHSLIIGQNSSTPICPKMKQTSCLSRLHWLLQCCLVRSRQRVRMASLFFLFRSRYISRYFSNRLSFSDCNRPNSEWALYSAPRDFEAIRDWSSAQLKGAAGSIVRWQSSPQCFFNSLCFNFSMAIMQVQWSYWQGDSRYFSQQSMMVGSKQLPRAQAASCLDSAFSVSSAILLIRKSLTSPYCSSLSWPSAQSSSCLSRTELPQRGQASINVLMASSLPMFFSWKMAKQRALIAQAGLNRVSLQSVCIPVVDAGLSKNII